MLMKKGGTREEGRTRELLVPVSAAVAAVVRRNADDEARERGEMKKLVLATHTKQQQREDGVGAFVQVGTLSLQQGTGARNEELCALC
ncbi:MAG: hypothetical protein WDW38_006815 [Sanguina aurantia]